MSFAFETSPEAEQRAALCTDALAGLTSTPKTLPCKWLYDAEGARLFGEITQLPEYYPTRTEMAILQDAAPAIGGALAPGQAVVEFGSGDGVKASILLTALRAPAAYVPVDIAPEWVMEAAERVGARHPGLPVLPVVADFTRPFPLPPKLGRAPRLGFFPGSTIGNFEPAEAAAFLRRARTTLGAGARMLLGADLVKDPAVLEAAYDDSAGVTAAFNLNLLRRLNREAGYDFDLNAFRHRAIFNAELSRIEMHIVSERDQLVRVGNRRIRFGRGETIHTESSHKYRLDTMPVLAEAGGWRVAQVWTDPAKLFSVWLFEA